MADTPETPPEGHKQTGRRPPRKRGTRSLTKCSTSPSTVRQKALSRLIFKLRLEYKSVRAIDEELRRRGYKTSKSDVQRILANELDSLGADQETKERARALALERLDEWGAGLIKRARKGDDKAIATALKLEERRARMLGIDAPTEQKLTILGQVNWIFDVITAELGPDAAQRVIRRISQESGPAAPDAGGPPGDEPSP